jgi:putative ABC transport system permease protein
MNLSTARASRRAKEVGVRKVVGAGRTNLLKQFLGESLLLSLVGVTIAVPLLLIALPYLNHIAQADIQPAFLKSINIWLMLATLIMVTTLVAGSYPAFYLSAFRAIKVIKGNFTNHISADGLRRSLVVFQFVLSIVLIAGIIVIHSQLNYIKNKDLGFEKEQRLVFTFDTGEVISSIPNFMNELRQLAGVKEVSNASSYFGGSGFYSNKFFLHGQKDADAKSTNFIVSDEHFVKANGIKLIAGRDFRSSDSSKVLINETYANQLGLKPLTAIGTLLRDNQSRTVEVVGVMRDFNYGTLHKEVESFLIWMLHPQNNVWPAVIVHANTADYKVLLSTIEGLWKKYIAGVPFSYTFLDEAVQKQYESEVALSRIINSFTVMGASAPGIVRLLTVDFLKLVVMAFVIATPIAWWTMNKWLESFASKINLSWWMFALAGLLAVSIALVTVCFQAIKAALGNPIKGLRTE